MQCRRSSGRTPMSRSPRRSFGFVWAKPGNGWKFAFTLALVGARPAAVRDQLHARDRHRRLGQQHPGRLGVRHHQLRLVDRHRPRRHADLRDPPALPAAVAHVDQPLRRGDDPVRGRLRADLPDPPHRPALVRGVLAAALPDRPRASGRSSARRSSGTCSRSRPTSRSRCCSGTSASSPTSRRSATRRRRKLQRIDLRHLRARLARLGPPLAPLRIGLPDAGRPVDAARALGAHDRVVRLRRLAHPRLAHDDLPALLRRRRRVLRLRDGDHLDGSGAAVHGPEVRRSRCGTSRT